MEDIMQLCDTGRQTAYNIHVYHGQGHLEKVYFGSYKFQVKKYVLSEARRFRPASLLSILLNLFVFSAFFRG
jgi:hypothetical protein